MDAFKPMIAKVAAGAPLSATEAESAFERILSGESTPAQTGAFLMALRVRGETVDEITGAVRAMLEHSHERHQALLLDPQAGEPGDTAAMYESRAMLYRTLALLGVWPGIDPQEWMWLNSPQPTPPRRQR